MDRTRVFALGAGTLAVALGAGLAVQHNVPQDHPAHQGRASLAAGENDLREDHLEDMAASVVNVAADLGAGETTHGAMAGRGWPGGSEPRPAGAHGTADLPPSARSGGAGAEAQLASAAGLAELGGMAAMAARPDATGGTALTAGMGMAIGSGLWSLPSTAPARPSAPEAGAAGAEIPQPASPDGAQAAGGNPAGPGCAPRLQLGAAPGAMIGLVLDAPCLPEARVVIRHAGLAVTARTSAMGRLEMDLPALAEDARVSVALPGPQTVSAHVAVPDLPEYDRIAVQWQGVDSFQLHAYEFGAEHGAPGHVSGAAPAGPQRALDGIGGFLTLLGDSRTEWPLLAEVYSFPAARLPAAGTVELVLEAAITEETCGRPLMGEALEVRRGARPVATDIDVAMPGCEAVGGYVQLKRVLSDLTLARN